ncbi:hypothetical protein [Paraburkholderia sp. JHI869]|uniref:hypothetical protein n=1 Tax=Paraburkholderia sp. JHI869 TaxID=3112959 RepID=UPI00316C4064
MSRRPDNGEQFWHDHMLARRAELNDFATQSAKAASILNGGGAVAMLGLLQALVLKVDQFHAFRPFGLIALGIFIAGAVASGLMFVARWVHAGWLGREGRFAERRATQWMWVIFWLMWTPHFTFIIGCCAAGFGIWRI